MWREKKHKIKHHRWWWMLTYNWTSILYVPNARVCLLSVQTYCHKLKEGCSFNINEYGCQFHFSSFSPSCITFPLFKNGNIPQSLASRPQPLLLSPGANLQQLFTVLSPNNSNLRCAQHFLLQWYWSLGCAGFQWIQYLISSSIIPCYVPRSSSTTCKWHTCQLGKQVQPTGGVNKVQIRPQKDSNLKKESLDVGAVVSSDQFVSSVRGRLTKPYGKDSIESIYIGGTIFIGETSDYIYLQNQVSLGAVGTVRAKHCFECDANQHGIPIQTFRVGNGIYCTNDFLMMQLGCNKPLNIVRLVSTTIMGWLNKPLEPLPLVLEQCFCMQWCVGLKRSI